MATTTITTETLQLQKVNITGGGGGTNINFVTGTVAGFFTEDNNDLAAEQAWAQNFLGDPSYNDTHANIFGDIDGAGLTEFVTIG